MKERAPCNDLIAGIQLCLQLGELQDCMPAEKVQAVLKEGALTMRSWSSMPIAAQQLVEQVERNSRCVVTIAKQYGKTKLRESSTRVPHSR